MIYERACVKVEKHRLRPVCVDEFITLRLLALATEDECTLCSRRQACKGELRQYRIVQPCLCIYNVHLQYND